MEHLSPELWLELIKNTELSLANVNALRKTSKSLKNIVPVSKIKEIVWERIDSAAKELHRETNLKHKALLQFIRAFHAYLRHPSWDSFRASIRVTYAFKRIPGDFIEDEDNAMFARIIYLAMYMRQNGDAKALWTNWNTDALINYYTQHAITIVNRAEPLLLNNPELYGHKSVYIAVMRNLPPTVVDYARVHMQPLFDLHKMLIESHHRHVKLVNEYLKHVDKIAYHWVTMHVRELLSVGRIMSSSYIKSKLQSYVDMWEAISRALSE